jgi:hypothetical protein
MVSKPNYTIVGIGTSSAKFDVMKFDGSENFGSWQRRVKDLLVQQGMVKALYGTKPKGMADMDWMELEAKVVATSRLCLRDDVMYHVIDKESPVAVWLKLESRYLSKVIDEQALSKAPVVLLEDGGGLGFEPTHQRVQSNNRRFEEG